MNLVKTKKHGGYLQEIQDEMSRIIEDAFEDLGLVEERGIKHKMTWRPAVELNSQNGNYELKAELPGINKDNINVEVSEDSVTINAECEHRDEEKTENVYRSEFRYGKYHRTIPLPSSVDYTNAKAEYKNGILTLTLPKSEEEKAKTKKIEIKD